VYTDILKRWAEEEGLALSLREMLDRFGKTQQQGPLERARRRVAEVVDATLPKAIPSITQPRARSLTESDVEAELEAVADSDPAKTP
jgi:hypothetical protein